MSLEPYFYAIVILLIMFGARYLYLSISTISFNTSPLVYMSPRGLISILLFIQLEALENEGLKTNIIDERVLLLVILISMIVMLFGTLNNSKKQEDISLEIEKPLNDEIDSDFLNKQIND